MAISTQAPIRAVLDDVGHHSHASAGFTTALVGATGGALGQAVLGISGAPTSRLSAIVPALESLADDDIHALDRLVTLRAQGREAEGWEALVAMPLQMGELACEAAEILQANRAHVAEHVKDDLEFSIVLVAAAARSALLIVESNLRQWRAPALHARFGPESERLAHRIAALSPIERLAWR
jgi:hypothetical protein